MVDKLISARNKNPVEEFEGFSFEDMYQILYFPFSERCPIQFKRDIDTGILDSPIFNIVLHFLNILDENDGVKVTAKGNLPLKVVNELYEKKYIVDEMIEGSITKIRSEEDWRVIHSIKVVLKMAGLIRQYKGKLLLTKSISKEYQNNRISNLFFTFFESFTTEFNWAYNDAYGNDKTGQMGFLYLLHLVNKHGTQSQELTFYTDKYFDAFPMLRTEERAREADVRYGTSEKIVELRFFERFSEWFGFVDISFDESADYFNRKILIRKTGLLTKLFE
jgi:hypothetical protein